MGNVSQAPGDIGLITAGPVCFADENALYFTTLPRPGADRSAPARISRYDRFTGERGTIVEEWRGLPFNSSNDVVVAHDGAIWFTDPSYGHLQGFRAAPEVGDSVYRHDPASGVNFCFCGPDYDLLLITDDTAVWMAALTAKGA